jgi:exopolyphosphatase/guanosine-5'-triphosphate,3'-diphosphate pyrophosphatase
MPPLASVDIGSNTLRLLIAEGWTSGPLKPIRVERRITRLGERFLPARILQPDAMARSIAALGEFARLMAERGVQDYLAAATAVVREAGRTRRGSGCGSSAARRKRNLPSGAPLW